MAYSEAPEIISEFKNKKGMQLAATYYHYRKGGARAVQFFFHQGKKLDSGHCLLSYVCSRFMFDFKAAVSLSRSNDSTPYLKKFPENPYQLEIFADSHPF